MDICEWCIHIAIVYMAKTDDGKHKWYIQKNKETKQNKKNV